MDETDRENKGYTTRRGFFKGPSMRAEFIGRLCSPIFNQHKALPSQLSMNVKLTKSRKEFCLMYPEGDFDLKLVEAVLMVQKVSVTSLLKESYIKMLEEDHPIPYHLRVPQIMEFVLHQGQAQFVRDNILVGRLPRRMLFGMVDGEAYYGSPTKNPFNFQDFGLIEFCLYKDGMPYPRPMIKLDIENEQCAEAYHHFMSSLGAAYSNMVPDIELQKYMQGTTLFSFDMSPDQLGSVHPSGLMVSPCNLRLEMKFKKPLPTNINLLVYTETEHLLEIHRDRRVFID
jgi:hypothetical protein